MTEDDKKMSAWGSKFAQYLTASSRGSVPNPDLPFNPCEGFYSVTESKVGAYTLVFSSKVDAVSQESPDGTDGPSVERYVEFKTTTHASLEKRNFKRFKLLKWWAQSVLIGVSEIVCGLRDDNGIVSVLRTFPTENIPIIAANPPPDPWMTNVCWNFLDHLLGFIKSNVTEDDKGVVHVQEFSDGRVTCKRQTEDEYKFLPSWYTDNEPR
ncbi:decapping and exoribonuclease protein-like [Mya arenaria]|uniref:decapping and exoribonuclease protein-like n=1 Tax=Mya arenaria TaxID=6604 RepID=UPI0022E19216|nr:decapping and exoribonuclease protein-like [Mya arenaria]